MKKREKIDYIEYYLKIKENKKLYLPFENSFYEETIQQLKNIIDNIEIMLNETLNYQIYDFSKEIFNLFSDIQNIIFKKNLSGTHAKVREIKQKIDDIINNLKDIYKNERDRIIKEFNITKKHMDEITIYDFNYNVKSNENFVNSLNKIIKIYKDLFSDLDIHLNDHIEYFQKLSKKELNSLEYDTKFKDYFIGISEEYIEIIQLIEEKKFQSQENFKNEDYQEYDYFNSEDYKNSYWSKFYKIFEGIYSNFMHDYAEDRRNYCIKIIKEINSHFNRKKNFFLNYIENNYNKVNNKINRYKAFFNSKWKNIITNNRKYLDLSKKMISFLEEELIDNYLIL